MQNTWHNLNHAEINYKLWQLSEWGWAQVFRDPQPSGKSWTLKLWASTQAITARLNTHHIINPNHSENIPSSFTKLICHPPQPTAVFTPPGPLIGMILLTEPHLRSMWESGSSPESHPARFLLRSVTTINVCNNKEIGAKPKRHRWRKPTVSP